MKVSILVPVYNAESFITRCATSLFEQTYNEIEYVFVNDCSIDKSMSLLYEITEKYPHRKQQIKIVNNQKNQGIAKVRNILLENATGDYIYFVDSDDYIEITAIESLLDVAIKTRSDIVRYNYYEIQENNIKHRVENKPFSTKQQLLSDAISSQSGVDSMWKLFVKRELFTLNKLTFTLGINGCEDYIMSIKLFFYANKITDINEAYYYYTVTGNNQSMTKNTSSVLIDRMNAIEEIRLFLIKKHVFDDFKTALFHRILLCKQVYLINKKHFNLEYYMTTYPETNTIWRHFTYGRREKMLFWLAEHNFTLLIKLYYRFCN